MGICGCCVYTLSETTSPLNSKKTNNGEGQDKKSFKLLLLGAHGSGKSTVFQQVKILYGGGYENDDLRVIAITIQRNMVESIKTLIDQCPKCVRIDHPELVAQVRMLPYDIPFDEVESIGLLIEKFWADFNVKLTYTKKRSNYHLGMVHYFFSKAKKVMSSDYIPSQDDLLHYRSILTGVKQETFTMDDGRILFRLLDVGGSQNERKKWVKCFENVTVVLYVVAINEYNQLCYEDNETNRVSEALDKFEDIVNSEWFIDVNIVLFLNKKDLLKENIKKDPPRDFLNDYKGDGSYESMIEYFQKSFDERNEQEREVVTHVTCATDTNSIKAVFENQVKTILQNKQCANML